MAKFDLHPAGSALFSGSESFMRDLSEADESMITGGTYHKKNSSDSDSGNKNKKEHGNYSS